MSTLRVDNLNARTGTTISVPTGTKLYAPGHVIQVVTVTKTDTFSSAAASWVDITGLSLSITPTTINSKILVYGFVSHGGPSTTTDGAIRFVRNSTPVGIADALGSRAQASFSGFYRETYELGSGSSAFFDSPATTSSTTYKLQMKANGVTIYINRTNNDEDNLAGERGISTLVAMEIAQ